MDAPTSSQPSLHDAALRGDSAAVCAAVERGGAAALEARSEAGWTPLVCAAHAGHAPLVALLLARGADPEARSTFGHTALGAAAIRGHAEAARLLLAHGARVDARDRHGATPLMYAAAWGRLELARLLLAHGADPEATDEDGEPPWLHAEEKGHRNVAEVLVGAHPVAQLYYALTRGGRPSLDWVIEWSRHGLEPVHAAWREARTPDFMLRLLDLVGGPCVAVARAARAAFLADHAQRSPGCEALFQCGHEADVAAAIRQVVAVPPTLQALLAAAAARR